jgi:ketosteroid isomerase-like protein
VDAEAVRAWVNRYREAWESNDPDVIGDLFSEDARYFTEPYAKPWAGREGIVKEWLDHRDEPGQTEFRFEVVGIDGDLGFVRGWTRYLDPPPREYSNLWTVRLDDDGRCVEFVEWWMRHGNESSD